MAGRHEKSLVSAILFSLLWRNRAKKIGKGCSSATVWATDCSSFPRDCEKHTKSKDYLNGQSDFFRRASVSENGNIEQIFQL